MVGPRIIAEPDEQVQDAAVSLANSVATGIRRTNCGSWAVIIDGKLVTTESGVGCKARAITKAGTNRVVA